MPDDQAESPQQPCPRPASAARTRLLGCCDKTTWKYSFCTCLAGPPLRGPPLTQSVTQTPIVTRPAPPAFHGSVTCRLRVGNASPCLAGVFARRLRVGNRLCPPPIWQIGSKSCSPPPSPSNAVSLLPLGLSSLSPPLPLSSSLVDRMQTAATGRRAFLAHRRGRRAARRPQAAASPQGSHRIAHCAAGSESKRIDPSRLAVMRGSSSVHPGGCLRPISKENQKPRCL